MTTPTNKPIEPLPCPFCGEDVKLIEPTYERQYWRITCESCGLCMYSKDHYPNATKAKVGLMITWNRRTPLTQSHAEEKEGVKMLNRQFTIAMTKNAELNKQLNHCHEILDLWGVPRNEECDGNNVELSLIGRIEILGGTPMRDPIKILTSSTQVSEGDKFTHVTIEVYSDLWKKIQDMQREHHNEKASLQDQNERMREALKWALENMADPNNDPTEYRKWYKETKTLTSPPSESIKTELYAAQARIRELEEALKQYADKDNWGYYDESGCRKGIGDSEEACFIGTEVARNALSTLPKEGKI